MYLRAILCTFQISVDFYYVPVGGRGGRERGAGEGRLERGGWNLYCMGTVRISTVPVSTVKILTVPVQYSKQLAWEVVAEPNHTKAKKDWYSFPITLVP
jgi:hypothetical protein